MILDSKKHLLQTDGNLPVGSLVSLREEAIVKGLKQCPGLDLGIAGRIMCFLCVFACLCVYVCMYVWI